MKIYLDDVRTIPEGWVGARTPEEFVAIVEGCLASGEKIEAIAFDNDLGVPTEGYHLTKWLRDNHPLVILEAECTAHSSNTGARESMIALFQSIKEHPEEIREMAAQIEMERKGNEQSETFIREKRS